MLTVTALLAFTTFMAIAGLGYLCVCTWLETQRIRRNARRFNI